jgi:hypothetical protein
MPHPRLLGLLLLAAMVGCASRPPAPSAPVASAGSSPEFAALAYLMEQHASFSQAERDHYSAYVVPDSPLGAAIVEAFAGKVPPVSRSIKVDSSSGEARDAANNRPVKCWDAKLVKLGGERAVVYVSWYSGSLGEGGHRVELAWREGKWVVLHEEMEWVS